METMLLGTAGAFGLAAAAGLNTTLPLLLVGFLARLGLVTLASPFDALSSDVALLGLGMLSLLEFGADKIPGLDSVAQLVQWPLTLTAGAVLFASQNSILTEVSPGLTIVIGVVLAGGVHGLRSAARPIINLSTFGIGAPVASILEDSFAVVLTLFALLATLLAIPMLLLVGYVGYRAASASRRLFGRAKAYTFR